MVASKTAQCVPSLGNRLPGSQVEQARKEKADITTETPTAIEPDQARTVEEKIQQLQERSAPELGRVALENGIPDLTREVAAATVTQDAGRKGARQGRVSEFTIITPFRRAGRNDFASAAAARRQLSARRQGWHRSRHALRVPETTTRSCSSRPHTTTTGTPTSTTSRRRSPTPWIYCSAIPRDIRGFTAHR